MTLADQRRIDRFRHIGCIACLIEGDKRGMRRRNTSYDIHHLNEGGKAGQKRRGDAFTIPLCPWHHRGVTEWLWTAKKMAEWMGPSLAK
jgi:hypothetical protein